MGQKWTGEMVREFLESEGYKLIEVPNWDWVKSSDRIVVSCGEHEPYRVTRNSLQQGKRCAKCSGNHRYSHNEICEEVKKLDENYFVCSDSPIYENANTKLKLSCGKHFHFASWNEFQKGNRCPRCSGKHRYTHQEICEEVKKLDSEYHVCSDSPVYENAHTKLKLYHSVCGNEFGVTWDMLKQGRRPCGCHTNSKNEVLIREYLKSKNIKFKEQVTFDDLKSKSKLRYDFGIYENDRISILIEFDGQQHFEPRTFGGISQEQAEENLIKTQHHDKLKTDFSERNNIPLFRFTYRDKFEEIEEMLNFILYTTLAS